VKRRQILLAAGAMAATGTLFAQVAKHVYRVATLDDAVESARARFWQVFRNRLRELLIKDGNDVAYESRYASGDTKALPSLAQELVALHPDLIVCAATPAAEAAIKATGRIGIVFIGAGDPVASRLVTNLARPGSNVTGTSVQTTALAGKYLEFMRELAPGAHRIAYLTDMSNQLSMLNYRRHEERAPDLGFSIELFDGREPDVLESSLAEIKRKRLQGLIVGAAGTLIEHRVQIVRFAARERLPAVYSTREYADAGGLLSYSVDYPTAYQRAGDQAHRILRGASAGDLPVEQISAVRAVLNRKAARALGIKIPESIRARVDEVIE